MMVARTLLGATDLLREWTSRTIRARYQQSLLGWLWAVIQPLTQAAIFAVIFTRVVPVETGDTPYLAFAYVATVPWAFLAASVTDMANSLVENMNLVNKIYFPREVLPVATMLARLMDFFVAFLLFFGFAAYYGIPLVTPALVFFPIVLLVQVGLVAGIGLACAAGNVFVRDVRSLLALAIQLWFYASPVIYPVEAVPEAARRLYVLNPMVGIIEGYRAILLKGEGPDASLTLSALISGITLIIGYWTFKRAESRFADIV